MSAPLDHVALVCGFPGSGKTFMLQKLEALHRPQGARFVVHDRLGHWEELPGRVVAKVAEPEEAARIAVAHAPCTLVLDEAALAFPAQGWSPKRSPALNEVLKVGRQAAAIGEWRRPGPVSILMAAQRPANVHPDVKSFLNRIYIGKFPRTATTDLNWLHGVSPDICTETDCTEHCLFVHLDKLPFGRFKTVFL